MLQHHGNPSALEAALVRRSCRVGRSARRVCFPTAAHPWAARLAALEAVGGFVQRLQALARQGGVASPASAPAADDAGGAAAVLQGDAVAWVAEVVPGAPGALRTPPRQRGGAAGDTPSCCTDARGSKETPGKGAPWVLVGTCCMRMRWPAYGTVRALCWWTRTT